MFSMCHKKDWGHWFWSPRRGIADTSPEGLSHFSNPRHHDWKNETSPNHQKPSFKQHSPSITYHLWSVSYVFSVVWHWQNYFIRCVCSGFQKLEWHHLIQRYSECVRIIVCFNFYQVAQLLVHFLFYFWLQRSLGRFTFISALPRLLLKDSHKHLSKTVIYAVLYPKLSNCPCFPSLSVISWLIRLLLSCLLLSIPLSLFILYNNTSFPALYCLRSEHLCLFLPSYLSLHSVLS